MRVSHDKSQWEPGWNIDMMDNSLRNIRDGGDDGAEEGKRRVRVKVGVINVIFGGRFSCPRRIHRYLVIHCLFTPETFHPSLTPDYPTHEFNGIRSQSFLFQYSQIQVPLVYNCLLLFRSCFTFELSSSASR